jgi:hypothetical protein
LSARHILRAENAPAATLKAVADSSSGAQWGYRIALLLRHQLGERALDPISGRFLWHRLVDDPQYRCLWCVKTDSITPRRSMIFVPRTPHCTSPSRARA